MGWLGQVPCSCGSLSIIMQWSRTDWKKGLPIGEYGATIGWTVLELDALVFLWRRLSQEWRRSVVML